MRKRGSSQLLPTPQTSTTSSTWDKADYEDLLMLSSSERDGDEQLELVEIVNERGGGLRHCNIRNTSILKSFTLQLPLLKRPRLLRSCSTVRASYANRVCKSSWPFRSAKSAERIDFSPSQHQQQQQDTTVSLSVDSVRLKNALERDFPYQRAIERLSSNVKALLFDKSLWKFLLKVSMIYAGDNVHGDRQKRNEIALAAWTTLVRVYAKCHIRGGAERMQRLAVAAVVLQSKLLEESDVDLVKLSRKLGKITHFPMEKAGIEAEERKICDLLNWKLLTPSPQVILFLALDVLGESISLPTSLKLLVSKVLDRLIEDFFVQEHCENGVMVGALVRTVLEIVLQDFFSVFCSKSLDLSASGLSGVMPELPRESTMMRGQIERAIEWVVNNPQE